MHFRTVLVAVAALVLAEVGPCGSTGVMHAQTDPTVTINDFAFSPAEVVVLAGVAVIWTNAQNGVPHTTTSLDGVWDSGRLATGDAFLFTFDQAGTYAYQCTIHPPMRGTVRVVSDPSELPQ